MVPRLGEVGMAAEEGGSAGMRSPTSMRDKEDPARRLLWGIREGANPKGLLGMPVFETSRVVMGF